jgi:lipoprotein-releasing system permease protein
VFEARIGWRYLYSGNPDRRMLLLAAIGGVITLFGGLWLMSSNAANPSGVLMLVGGMITTIVCGLLALLSVFTSVSVLGVVLGVAALTIVLAVTTGFEQQFRDKVLGVNAHVIVLKSQNTFAEYREVMKTAQEIDPDVIGVQPFIFAEMLVTRGQGVSSGVAIKGVDPKLVRSVLDLDKHMIEGSIDTLARPPPPPDAPPGAEPSPIILGKELAHKLKAKVGDDVTVVVPMSNIDFDTWRVKSSAPRSRKFRITGIFYSGFDEYDRRLMYTSLPDTQELVGRGDQVMGVELKLRDVSRGEEIAERLEKALGGPPYQVQDWYELNHNLFRALKLQKLALVIILTLIIIVAAVNMVSALYMTVTEKTREIAIIKSMGATSWSVGWVFMIVGTTIGAIGTLLGVCIGLATCYAVGSYGYHLDPRVYLIDRLPIDVRPLEVVVVAAVTVVIGMIAAIVPAMAASSLRPVDGLRYD